MRISPNNLSRWSLLVCYIVMIYVGFLFYPKWTKTGTEATISWDVSGYYMYLPALFIYNDLAQCNYFKDSLLAKYQPTPNFQQAFVHEKSGNYVMKYSSGQAFAMLPFFFAGHFWATRSAIYPPDGYSFPYQVCLGVGMFLYALVGLYFLRKILLYYFKDTTVALLLLLYVLGTNYLNYAAIDQAMTHNTLFTLYTLIIFFTINFYRTFSRRTALFIGLLAGWAVLIRPTEIIALIIPLLWGISSWQDAKDRMGVLKTHFFKILMAAFAFAAVVSIQLVYWKWAAGEWIVYSYQDQGFSWLKPHIGKYTMSYRSGWWRYCPMMVFPYIGIIPFIHMHKNLVAVLSFTVLNFYIVTAWDVWDFGGRAMVQSYPILAFLMCALIEAVAQKGIYKALFYPLFALFLYINIWWTYHSHKGSIQVFGVSPSYYWQVIGRWSIDDEYRKLLDNKFVFRGTPQNVLTVYKNDFEADTSKNNTIDENSNKAIKVNGNLQFSQEYTFSKPDTLKDRLRFSAEFSCAYKEWNQDNMAQFSAAFYHKGQKVQGNMIRVYRFLNNGDHAKKLYFDAVPPKKWDKAGVFLWNARGGNELFMDNLEVITF